MKSIVKTVVSLVAIAVTSATLCWAPPFRLPVVTKDFYEDCSAVFVESSGNLTVGDSATVYTNTTYRCVSVQVTAKSGTSTSGIDIGMYPVRYIDPNKVGVSWVVGDGPIYWSTTITTIPTTGYSTPNIPIPNGANTIKIYNSGAQTITAWNAWLIVCPK